MRPSFKNIVILFVLSFLVTAVFSVSIKKFFAAESWTLNLSKGLLIPCFTWTVQLVLSALLLRGAERLFYWTQLGVICLVGSIALLPAGFYNFAVDAPSPYVSIFSVLLCVAIMCVTLYFRLKPRAYNVLWTIGWTATIIVNMSLYARSINLI
jgi:asparagine N-glycosylation enzyme membrane subunit Stt3